MVVIQYFPNEYKQIQAQVKAGKSQNEAERQAIGGTHADIGAFVFGMWQLSSDTVQSAMFHHHPLALIDQVKDLSKHAIILNLSVAIADGVTDVDSFEGMARSEQLYEQYKPLLGDVDIDVGAIYTRVEAAVKELKKIFA
jgi:HD-like signal output (HDOD) protein